MSALTPASCQPHGPDPYVFGWPGRTGDTWDGIPPEAQSRPDD